MQRSSGRELLVREESLLRDEKAFLLRRIGSARTQLYKTATAFMIISFLVPFIFAWVNAIEDDPDTTAFSYEKYFGGVAYLLCLSAAIIAVMYLRNSRPLIRDLLRGIKTTEQTTITRKLFVEQNGSCHLFLTSPTKNSIEVEAPDFKAVRVGDEINIAYTPKSKIYLGYF